MRWSWIPLAAVLGFATAVLPAVTGAASEPTIEAGGGSYGYSFYWQPSSAEVSAGGKVAFQNSSSMVEHGVVWSGGPETPSCTGVPIGKGELNWKGTCTFTHPGVYSFHCFVHPKEMTGTITVTAAGTTTTTTTAPTTTTTTGTTTATTPTIPSEPPAGSPLLGAPTLRHSQRGPVVDGSLDVARTGSGDRLEVDVFARSASLARRSGRTLVGRFVRGAVSAGRLSFAVKLDARARRALRRHRHLALTVVITLTPGRGTPLSVTQAVLLHT
jgi:plastocyanin